MSKEWHCEDCCCLGTDACYYGVKEGKYPACNRIVVDHDKAYQQGIKEGLEQAFNKLDEGVCDECEHSRDKCWRECGKEGWEKETFTTWLKGQINEHS